MQRLSFDEWRQTHPPMAGGDPEGDPAPPAVPAPVAPPAPANPGPWDADLSSMFQDEATRGQVDQFLREKIQPHVTQLEQFRSQAEPATELYKDLLDPEERASTYVALTQEMWGEDAAQAVVDLLNAQNAPPPADPNAPVQPTVDQLPPEVQELIKENQDRKHAEMYAQELGRIKEADPELVDDWFHPFVVASEGNFDRAHQSYQTWLGTVREKFAPATPTLEAEVPAPPPTLGLPSAPSVTAPPTQKEYKGWGSLDDALNDTLAEMKADREAPVTIG